MEKDLNGVKLSFHPKPPLRVIPKKIFEMARIHDLCLALMNYVEFENEQKNTNTLHNLELMIKWSEELVERLNNIKFDLELEYENNIDEGID